jgi:ATP-dependent protease ClpP protease subunit
VEELKPQGFKERSDDFYLSAEEVKEYGLIDEVIKTKKW